MQRPHPVADVRQQPACDDELVDATREVVHRRVDERDDQHLLIVGKRGVRDELRGQRRQCVRLAAARHRRHAHTAAAIGEDFLLSGTGLEHRSNLWLLLFDDRPGQDEHVLVLADTRGRHRHSPPTCRIVDCQLQHVLTRWC